ncbi:NAD(P)-dependent oxidoreductase [Parashewanella spongiae]|uniref:NAD(P)-dependent oxidoreductase n=1 Tax=Parashewanella spongiae TaxID=342950 RepID=A0A3A6TRB2_9GAMM|nr:NAD(P)-dependent oxidoreductase [Parashewanella spongiae]MCL1077506.1 NAD(P)-dependent oxidoreductase [Parashewanella spongiae]RJY18637.1 NAD(P)-dependent oxidoreductase [Parashewanella spongiae]
MAKVAFIGLGVMGYPMAGHLQKNGHEVTVYNRTSSKAEKWVAEFGGQYELTPRATAKGQDIVFTCVGNDDDLRQVILGDGSNGVIAGMSIGSILIDHTTASAEVARELSLILSKAQIDFMDAPVSGGQAGAENGQLTVMMGGEQSIFDKAKPVIDAFARCAELLGPVGSGQLAKMVNQICIAGVVQGLAEGLNFAKRAGLDGEKVVEVISKGAAQSWQMENRYKTMLNNEYDFGFAVDWMRKDLGIALDEARKNGSALPLTAMVDQYYADVQNIGGHRWDTSSLMARLEQFNK